MYRSFIVAAVVAMAGRTVAQTADFVNTTWDPVTVGSLWPVHWSEGNGEPVTLYLGNATWTYTIVEDEAAPGMYDWTIAVPDGFVEGEYSLSLEQVDTGTSTSPVFGISFNTLPPMSSMSMTDAPSISPTMDTTLATSMTPNATMMVSPTITVLCPVIWYDEDCSCTKTTTTPVVMPTPTSTEYVFHDEECDCSKTAMVPEATLAPSNNYTAPMTTPQPMPPAGTMAGPQSTGPAGWMGAASHVKLSASMIAAVVFVAAAFVL